MVNNVNKKVLLLVGAVVLLVGGYFGYQYFSSYWHDRTISVVANEVVNYDDLGLTFSYPSGEEGFTLVEPPVSEGNLLKASIMMPTADYIDLQNSTDAREAPASMSVFIFKLDDVVVASTTAEEPSRITRLQNWAIDNNNLSSFNQAQNTPEVFNMDGVNALHYRADGLYQQDIYLASYRNKVYMFVGQFNAETDPTFTAFQNLIASVSFN